MFFDNIYLCKVKCGSVELTTNNEEILRVLGEVTKFHDVSPNLSPSSFYII